MMLRNPFASRAVPIGLAVFATLGFDAGAQGLEQDGELEEIVVTATRFQITSRDAPASVSVLTPDDMAQMTYFTVDETLKNVVGVMNRRTKGFMETTPSLTIRGFASARDNLVLLDGVPQNDSRNGQVNWTMIDGETVERIEVARGPFSSLYGGNAMGGVVSIFTRVPAESGASFKVGVGGALDSVAPEDSRDLAFSGSLKVAEPLTLGVNYRQRTTDGYPTTHVNVSNAVVAALPAGTTGAVPYLSNIGAATNLVGDMGDNWYDDETVGARLVFAPSSDTRLDLTWVESDSEYGYDTPNSLLRTPSVAGPAGPTEGTTTFANIPLTTWLNGALFARGGSIGQTNYGLNLRTRFGEISAQLAAGRIEKSTETIIVGGITLANSGHGPLSPVTLEGGDGRLAPANDTTRSTADLQFDWPLAASHRLIFGISGSDGDIDEERWSLEDWTRPRSKYFMGSKTTADDQTYALYVQDAWTMNEALTVYLGARQDWWEMNGGITRRYEASGASGTLTYGKTDASSFNPKLSLVYRPGESTGLRASVGKAFRPPTLFEFFGTAQIGGDSFVGNPDLEPETVLSWEAGVDHTFAIGVNVVATYYQSDVDDLIETVSSGGISRPENTSEAEIRGVELELSGPLPKGFSWSANYTYTDSEVTRNENNPALVGKQLVHVPEHMYNLSLDWVWEAWHVTATNYYQSKRYTRADNLDTNTGVPGSTDSFNLTDLKVSYGLSDAYRVSLGVTNVFDEEYRQFYLSPGRAWLLELYARY